jgi:hypothetical protein
LSAPLDPMTCLNLLISRTPKPLNEVSEGQGIYALADHRSTLRYIGMTARDSFRKRINSRHVTGSEENSHKFACAYNVGRMWYGKNCPEQDPGDAKLARTVRQIFVRKYCKAICVPVAIPEPELRELESAVLRIAPPEIIEWNGTRIGSQPEPQVELDSLIVELGWSIGACKALERQSALYERYGRKFHAS